MSVRMLPVLALCDLEAPGWEGALVSASVVASCHRLLCDIFVVLLLRSFP